VHKFLKRGVDLPPSMFGANGVEPVPVAEGMRR
jgi:hypothetical protein